MARKNDAKLRPCPLCGDPDPMDRGHGIECPKCGLWLGNGTAAARLGGYKKLWNKQGRIGKQNLPSPQ